MGHETHPLEGGERYSIGNSWGFMVFHWGVHSDWMKFHGISWFMGFHGNFYTDLFFGSANTGWRLVPLCNRITMSFEWNRTFSLELKTRRAWSLYSLRQSSRKESRFWPVYHVHHEVMLIISYRWLKWFSYISIYIHICTENMQTYIYIYWISIRPLVS